MFSHNLIRRSQLILKEKFLYQPWNKLKVSEEMANTAWGTYEYNGETLGSAIVGAEALPVVDGEVYIWVYQSF